MRSMFLLSTIFFLSTSCKEVESPLPPPIDRGKCLVDRYIGTQAMKQNCLHVGYSWTCVYNSGVTTCDRGSEANSERPPVPADAGAK